MKAAIRIFALFVAIAGLASASFAPATTKALSTPASVSASGAGPRSVFRLLCPASWMTPALFRRRRPAKHAVLARRCIARKCQHRVTLLCLGHKAYWRYPEGVRRAHRYATMPLSHAMSAMNAAEVCPLGRARLSVLEQGTASPVPGHEYYLALRAISTPLLMLVLHAESQPWGRDSRRPGLLSRVLLRPTSRARYCCSSFALRSSALRSRHSPGSPSWRS